MRSFGTEISGNRRRNSELSIGQRASILASLSAKQSVTKIAEDHNVSRQTIYNTRDRWQRDQLIKSRPRKGRPPITSRQKRYIYNLARKHPRWSYKAIIADLDESISKRTVQRILRRFNLRKWKSKKRIHLTADDAKARRRFWRQWMRFDHWEDILFSDECTVQRGSNSPVQFVFRFQDEALRPDLVNLTTHGRDISLMVYATIWIGGRSDLVVMERDPDAPRGGYSTNSYIKALEQGLLPFYEPGFIYQQDNAPIHRSAATEYWFETHGIWVMEWPPHSPDLNPIEPVWSLLKRELFRRYPNLANGRRRNVDWIDFKAALIDSWNHLDQDTIDRLIVSVPRRIKAVLEARGWYTKY